MNMLTGQAVAAADAIKLDPVDVRVEGVHLFYGHHHVLKDINLTINPGEFFAFLGPSGCGKTTLLRLIAGFNTAREGRVRINGHDIGDLPPWKRDVGLVFQNYALWPHMTVRANLAFGLEERRLPRAEINRRVDAALALVGLSHLADRRPSQLSGGQQQRVALARTIVIEPKVLLLDEPLSNLDAKMRVQVRRELRDLQQRLGLTTIFVTHDQEEANAVCDRIAVMNDGIIQQVGTPMELYERPANLFVAGFLGTANVLPGTVVGQGAERAFSIAGGSQIAIPPETIVPADARLVFRPQAASLAPASDTQAPDSLIGRIIRREFLGSFTRYGIAAAGTEMVVDEVFQHGVHLHALGDDVQIRLPESALLWLA